MNNSKLLCPWLLILLVSCGRSADDFETTYANRQAAEEDGAFVRGWLPDFVPNSTMNIRESHNVDTNECWLVFDFDKSKENAIVVELSIPSGTPQLPRSSSTQRRNWWPRALTSPTPVLPQQFQFYSFRDSRGGTWFVAIERQTPKAWCWQTSD
jgi:hypothetical protein